MAAGATTFKGYWQSIVEMYKRSDRVIDEAHHEKLYNLRHR